MKNLWTEKEAKLFSRSILDMRVYSSRLLGRNPELVLHGGGNTSVKGYYKNIFGKKINTLFIKGSGWDLISIEKEGFAPVDLNYLLKLSKLETLSDSQMVIEQRLATLEPSAPNPSVETILHALIPFKYVDHTHADAVLCLTNTPSGRLIINQIYDDSILVVPYVMPGFLLAKKIEKMTKNVSWDKLKGMILMNHGVFSFGSDAKQSYDRMINIVNVAENFLKKEKVFRSYKKEKPRSNLLKLAKIRKIASDISGKPCIALLNDSLEATGFSILKNATRLSTKGTLTPDHVIRTKPFAWIIKNNNLNQSAKEFQDRYDKYFEKNKTKGIKKLNNGPNWALWKGYGTICFGNSKKEAKIVYDINAHTIRALQTSFNLDNWKPISFKKLFEIEYWELEQAKLNKSSKILDFQGKIAIVTGSASGIGYSIAEKLLNEGCAVLGIDKDKKVSELFSEFSSYKGCIADLKNSSDIKKAVSFAVKEFGGLDILISNAGIFSSSACIDKIDDKKWEYDMDINLNSHHRILRECIPFLKHGIDPAVIFMGSRNVGAPGPGAGTYTIAKSGLTQMSRLSAIELAKYNIRVNIIHPDCVYDTGVWSKKILRTRAQEYGLSVEEYKSRNLLKVDVSSQDVAEMAVFFVSTKSNKTTGAQIPIDGGNERII